ncbi:hypothetical protein SLE2022_129290 [Rubroshorea leprosula]
MVGMLTTLFSLEFYIKSIQRFILRSNVFLNSVSQVYRGIWTRNCSLEDIGCKSFVQSRTVLDIQGPNQHVASEMHTFGNLSSLVFSAIGLH